MKKITITLLTLTSFYFLSCKTTIHGIKPIEITREFTRAIWVVRHSIATKEKADEVIEFTRKYNFDTLIVQIRGRGDSYYESAIEPSAVDIEPGFDPLAYLIKKGKELNIQIHGWINVVYAADVLASKPCNKHILSKHPEWANYDKWGKSLMNYSRDELKLNLLEGVYLDPGVPDVVNYLVSVVKDIVSRYDIDGLHFDFIRYPWSGFNGFRKSFLKDFGYNPEARMRFIEETGIDPERIAYESPTPLRELWRDFRRDRINEIVKRSYETVKKINPTVIVSAAVVANAPVVRNSYFQDWKKWVKDGYLDTVYPMSYDEGMYDFVNFIYLANKIKHIKPTFMGIYILPRTPVKLAAKQIRMIYENGFAGFCVFSYAEGINQMKILNEIMKDNRQMTRRASP